MATSPPSSAAPPPNFAPLTDYLSTFLDGRRVEVVPLDSIEQMVEAVDKGRLDFVVASPVALVTLTTRHRVRPIATVTQQAGDRVSPFLAGAVFVKSGRQDLQLLEDARGKRVLALSRLALGGWLAPMREWRRRGLTEADFGSLQFDFSYQDVAAKVCAGDADIGVLPANRFHDLRDSCPGGFRVLNSPQGREGRYPITISTPLYPEAAFAAVGDLDEDVVTRVAVALLAIDAGSPAARVVGVSGFTAPLSYTPVQQLMQDLRVGPYESFGRLTFTEAIRQHAGKVLIGMLAFLSVLMLAFVRSQRLNAAIGALDRATAPGRAGAAAARVAAAAVAAPRVDRPRRRRSRPRLQQPAHRDQRLQPDPADGPARARHARRDPADQQGGPPRGRA